MLSVSYNLFKWRLLLFKKNNRKHIFGIKLLVQDSIHLRRSKNVQQATKKTAAGVCNLDFRLIKNWLWKLEQATESIMSHFSNSLE